MTYGYDDYLIDVLQFEFKSVDEVFYESKESQFGNVGFYFKGSSISQFLILYTKGGHTRWM